MAAAGDDVFDQLMNQAVEEVGGICDGYVERVFEAEFALDLEQMAEQDVNDQMEQQQHHPEQARGSEQPDEDPEQEY